MKSFQITETRKFVGELVEDGYSVADIARVLDVSRARVYQHLKKLGMRPPGSIPSVMPVVIRRKVR